MLERLSKRFWDWVDERYVVRRIVLGVTLWMTWEAFVWGKAFAYDTTLTNGAEIGLIIAAVTVPITALQKWVLESYTSSRSKDTYKDVS